jgi:hypothetical protein
VNWREEYRGNEEVYAKNQKVIINTSKMRQSIKKECKVSRSYWRIEVMEQEKAGEGTAIQREEGSTLHEVKMDTTATSNDVH